MVLGKLREGMGCGQAPGKAKRLKQAKDEAEIEINRFKAEKEQQFKEYEARRLADQSTEFLWARQLPVLRTGVAKKVTDQKQTVHVSEQITVPPDIFRTLSFGPKFAVEPKTSPPELLAMVRQV
ncbi:hypothetical protein HPB51_025803 [Rhipicephalus microplus]|uniref:V-type proton ATPase subunit G n=1 Tax=Rhipicephalus microplus TaxID=6941 RepID=A0A9J6DYL3_RHIMP|nr:hypothetical protein HPB51_025803 [Rhipicephalus microplus]